MKELINLYSPYKEPELSKESVERQKQLVEQLLGRIDTAVIVDIFVELKRKAFGWERGSEEEQKWTTYMQYLLQNPVVETCEADGPAALQPVGDGDKVFGMLHIFVRELNVTHAREFSKLIRVVLHEAAHAISLRPQLENEELQIGFARHTKDQAHFTPLNEAFTEYIVDAVYSEYLRRTGNRDDTPIVSYGPIDIQYDREMYGVYREFLNCLIEEIETESGFSKDEITRSLLGHYMRTDFPRALETLQADARNLLEKFKTMEFDPFDFGSQMTNSADREKRLLPKLRLICRELLKTREGRAHVEAIFGADIFAGKKFVAR